MAETIAVYPGTFDPMTKGHFDLIQRAAKLYDRLIVAVAATSTKDRAMFTGEERLNMIREDAKGAGLANVEVKALDIHGNAEYYKEFYVPGILELGGLEGCLKLADCPVTRF